VRRKHQGLLVWQQSIALVKLVYTVTAVFPKHDRVLALIGGLINTEHRAAAK